MNKPKFKGKKELVSGGKEIQPPDMTPDWEHGCEVCDQKPIVPATGMCGPCTFGEAETIRGNWQ